MRINFELILNSVTSSQPQQRERGRASPTQRCGAGPRGPERFCAPPSGGGHCRPRGVLRPVPSSSSARPGAAAPRCVALAQAAALATPGPGARTGLRARKQDRGPRGLPNTPQVVVEQAQVRSPNGCPRAAPCARSHLHLHLSTKRLQGLGLPGWTWLSQHWTLPGIWALRFVRLRRAAEGKHGLRAGTPGGSLLHLNVCPLLPHPAHVVTFLSSALQIPHPTQRARRILTLNPNVVRRVWVRSQPAGTLAFAKAAANEHPCARGGDPTSILLRRDHAF